MAQPNQTRRIRAVRGFRFRGRVIGPGSVLDVNMTEFADLVHSGKAVKVDPDTKTTENSELPEPVDGRLKPDSPADDSAKTAAGKK